MSYTLEKLVDDIIIELLRGLPVKDILSVRQTCKRFSSLTRLRNIWHYKFCCEVLGRKPPIPVDISPLLDVSASDLEWRTRRALRLHKKWANMRSNTAKTFDLPGTNGRAHQVALLPSSWQLLTIHASRVVCWQIGEERGPVLSAAEKAEYIFPADDTCHIVRDTSGSDIIALGSSNRPNSTVVILSVGQGTAFTEHRVLSSLPGVPVGVYGHLIFCDMTTSSSPDEISGIEIRDWSVPGSGTVLCSRVNTVCGEFLDFRFFRSHLLIVWEAAICVFSMPDVPAEGQLVVDPLKIYLLAERIARPIAFTACKPDLVPDVNSKITDNAVASPSSLTIAARPKHRPFGIVHSLLRPLAGDTSPFPFGLVRIPQPTERLCSAMCFGSSGRGMWVQGDTVLRCGPVPMMMPFCDVQFTVDFMPKPIWTFTSALDPQSPCVDFDDSMGVIVVGTEEGKVSLVDLA